MKTNCRMSDSKGERWSPLRSAINDTDRILFGKSTAVLSKTLQAQDMIRAVMPVALGDRAQWHH